MIKISNKKELNNIELNIVEKIVKEFYNKLNKEYKIEDLDVNIKKTNTTGKQAVYEVHMSIDAPIKIATTKTEGWDLNKVLHKSINALNKEIEHRCEPRR